MKNNCWEYNSVCYAAGPDKVVNRTIVEMWLNFDALGLLQQVGAVPSPGAMAKKQCNTARAKRSKGRSRDQSARFNISSFSSCGSPTA
jgi:hypothetical protein